MARPVYPHELVDQDYQWLINSYRESHPEAILVDMSCLPAVLILLEDVVVEVRDSEVGAATAPPSADDGSSSNDTDFPE